MTIRVGLIGFGLAGQVFHAPTLRVVPGMELACILERHGSKAQEKYPEVRVARTLEELLSDETIRLCVIATPHITHFELAQRCLMAGRDVVVDKVFTPTLREAEQLIALAKEKKRMITVYQNRRWDGDFLTVRRILASGRLGRVVDCEVRFERFRTDLRPNSWREISQAGSGMLFDLGPHLVDQALLLFGEPLSVTASVFRQRETTKVDDAFDVCFEYPDLRVSLRARSIACAPSAHFTLHGTKGSFVKYGLDPQEDLLKAGAVPQGPDWGQDSPELWGTLTLAESGSKEKAKTEPGAYPSFYENVRDALVNGTSPAVTNEQMWRTMRALELAKQSSEQGKTMPWGEGRN